MILLSLFGILESPIPYASWIDIYTPSTLSFKHLPDPDQMEKIGSSDVWAVSFVFSTTLVGGVYK